MARIENLERLVAALRKRAAAAKVDGDASVLVGYTANYALYVHENMEMKLKGLPRQSGRGVYWGPKGQPKFLEEPARTQRDVLAKIVRDAKAKGSTLAQALLLAGLRLQRESQLRVPVDTGNLRASAFTRLER
jgi:hypothetical protein